ncbi:hypothetical protein [Clostridium sp.]|nr:hypothetical protein [Clostridium sp.]
MYISIPNNFIVPVYYNEEILSIKKVQIKSGYFKRAEIYGS